jgi:hypothetical protein
LKRRRAAQAENVLQHLCGGQDARLAAGRADLEPTGSRSDVKPHGSEPGTIAAFIDAGNRMSPTHSNKLGVRYRYDVSQAILQKRKADVVARVPAVCTEN